VKGSGGENRVRKNLGGRLESLCFSSDTVMTVLMLSCAMLMATNKLTLSSLAIPSCPSLLGN
jgi:hypothetical protein